MQKRAPNSPVTFKDLEDFKNTIIQAMSTMFDHLSAQINGNKQDIGGLKQDIGELKQDVGGLKKRMTNLDKEMKNLRQENTNVIDELLAVREDQVIVPHQISRQSAQLADHEQRLVVLEQANPRAFTTNS